MEGVLNRMSVSGLHGLQTVTRKHKPCPGQTTTEQLSRGREEFAAWVAQADSNMLPPRVREHFTAFQKSILHSTARSLLWTQHRSDGFREATVM